MSLHYLGKHDPQKLCLTVGILAFEGSVVTQKWLGKKYLHSVLNNMILLSTKNY